ncbi:hypothetical protein PoMZ_01080 [Pyricularia oryzae]|uniref:Uncharacterized protein n=1 Tax=Pyricularia oryzae TaxID=318829 RepID=A0A4P7N7W4_PYROR|nr:hypothetical protein PoMZ_01080 [Pyricularia oryzae]
MKLCALAGCLLVIPLATAAPILPPPSVSDYGLPPVDTGYPPVPTKNIPTPVDPMNPMNPTNDPYGQFPQAQPNTHTLQPGRNRCMNLKARSFSFGMLADIWKNPAKYSSGSHDCSGGSSRSSTY